MSVIKKIKKRVTLQQDCFLPFSGPLIYLYYYFIFNLIFLLYKLQAASVELENTSTLAVGQQTSPGRRHQTARGRSPGWHLRAIEMKLI